MNIICEIENVSTLITRFFFFFKKLFRFFSLIFLIKINFVSIGMPEGSILMLLVIFLYFKYLLAMRSTGYPFWWSGIGIRIERCRTLMIVKVEWFQAVRNFYFYLRSRQLCKWLFQRNVEWQSIKRLILVGCKIYFWYLHETYLKY